MAILSDERKWEIITAWKHSGNLAATARQCRVSITAVKRWVRRYKATGNVRKLTPGGRNPSMSPDAAHKAVEMLCNGDYGGSAGVAQQLHRQGFTSKQLHRTTVTRHAKAAASEAGMPIRVVSGEPAKRLTLDTKRKRLAFCLANKGRSWHHVLFTDRKRFLFSHPGASFKPQQWLRKGEVRTASKVNHAQSVNLYAGISRFGVTDVHLVAGTSKQGTEFFNMKGGQAKNITAREYEHVLRSTLLPSAGKIFGAQGFSHWVLQQDNDPTHKVASTVVPAWGRQHSPSVTLLACWPPNSPDLNLIENCWSYVQARVDAKGCKTFEEFKQTVLHEVQSIPKSMLANLFNSMPKRVARVIELDGDKLPC